MLGPRSSPRSGSLAIALAVFLVATAVPVGADTVNGVAVPSAPHANLVIGFQDAVNASLVSALGATLIKQSDTLALASVYTADPTNFTALAALNPSIAFVEPNALMVAESAGWSSDTADSAGWDSAGWDSAGWSSAGWDSAGWSSAGWDSAGWSSAGWDSAGWSSAGWDSAGWSSAAWDSAGWSSAGWSSAGWDSAGWNSAGWSSAGWDSAGWSGDTITARAAGTGNATGADPLLPYQWGSRAIHAFSAASLFTGTRATTLCIVDSGVDYTHPDLAANIYTAADGTHGYDFANGDNDPMDDAGHGTHVAGIAAAVAGNGKGIAGAARETILPVKVLNATGWGEEMDLALGISYCQDKGAKVISMSLGTTMDSKAVRRAVHRAYSAGIVLVAAVGNEGAGSNTPHYPAAYAQVIGVGALVPNGARAPYSTVGNSVDFAAPGYAIVSTLPGARYGALNGTSQATPFVAAALALMFDANATLARGDAMDMLVHTAHDIGPTGKDAETGYGIIDMARAIRAAMGLSP